jgi:hypothetical protein
VAIGRAQRGAQGVQPNSVTEILGITPVRVSGFGLTWISAQATDAIRCSAYS